MASRRTRIKGIANIPQRRKPTSNHVQEIGVDNHEEPKSNLDSEHVANDVTEKIDEPSSPKEKSHTNNGAPGSNEFLSRNPRELAVEDAQGEHSEILRPSPKWSEVKFLDTRNKQPQQAIPNTTLEATRDEKPQNLLDQPIVSSHMLKKEKEETSKNQGIIILNEIISYPGQIQPIIINQISDIEKDLSSKKSLASPLTGREDEQRCKDTDVREYPPPPPSPSKINRLRIKAVPRFGQRHISESEDDSNRHRNRHRNDSVCSSASGVVPDLVDCLSPQKPKEFSSVIQRKCKRTEQARKLSEARRDFHSKFGDRKPDRQKLTMMDLIFYNPTTNLMSHDAKLNKGSEEDVACEEAENEQVDDLKSDEENEMPAPQIKIGPDGEIVLDEQSLVIENKSVKKSREEIEKRRVVDGDSEQKYGIYKKAKRSKDWNKEETLKFYKALNAIGTDFTLMSELFPRRTRRELKMKFKKEERVNRALIDRAIMQPSGIDFEDLKHDVEMEEKELQAVEQQKEREKQLKKEAKKRKTTQKIPKLVTKKKKFFDISSVLDDDNGESEMETTDDQDFLTTIQKPTRSGRVPKLLERYRAEQNEARGIKAKPGSLIVVAETDSNGDPVYKVCMVTGEQTRTQIGHDMKSLEKAIECQSNGITSLFTLSASTLENHDSVIEERNVILRHEDVEVIASDEQT